MENKNRIGSGVRFSDWAVVILAVLLYFKTAEVLSYFAPQNISAFAGMDVAWLYGMITAFFVEGVAIAFHFHPGARRHTPAKIVMWILLVISGLCQIFDGKMVTDAIASMPIQQQVFFNYGVPLLPWFIIVMLFFVGQIPNADDHREWKGLKSYIPDKDYILSGKKKNTVVSAKEVVETNLEEELPKSPNGKDKETENPTIGKRS